jgi:hypothetical protein
MAKLLRAADNPVAVRNTARWASAPYQHQGGFRFSQATGGGVCGRVFLARLSAAFTARAVAAEKRHASTGRNHITTGETTETLRRAQGDNP